MKKHILLFFCILCLTACEDIQFKDLKRFNGSVIIGVSNFSDTIQKLDEPIKFQVSQGLTFDNILNNKQMTFDYEEIVEFSLGLSIMDTTGKTLVINEDFEVIQNGTSFSGERIYPHFNTRNETYEATFEIKFLKEGVYLIFSVNPNLFLKRDNFLFRDKHLTADFDVNRRNLVLAKKHFNTYFEYLDYLGENPQNDTSKGAQGLFALEVIK